jgi:hypothetical protein
LGPALRTGLPGWRPLRPRCGGCMLLCFVISCVILCHTSMCDGNVVRMCMPVCCVPHLKPCYTRRVLSCCPPV